MYTILVWSCSKLAQMKFKENKCAQFSSFLILPKKRWKKFRFKFEIWEIFKLESDFFPHFLSRIRKLENCAHLFILNFIWANFQQNQRTFFYRDFSDLLEKKKIKELLLNLICVHFTSNSNGKFFVKEIPCKNLVYHTRLILLKTCSDEAQRK